MYLVSALIMATHTCRRPGGEEHPALGASREDGLPASGLGNNTSSLLCKLIKDPKAVL